MAYLSDEEIEKLNFKYVGCNVKISSKASIYDHEKITIRSNSRIDDFCVISGNLYIGEYCHITPMCLIAGGEKGVVLEDFVTLAYGVKIFSQTDDYTGMSMVNSLIPKKYKKEIKKTTLVKRQTIIGAGSVIFPGVIIEEGCAIGANSLVNKSTESWGIYAGSPAKKIKKRNKKIKEIEKDFLHERKNTL